MAERQRTERVMGLRVELKNIPMETLMEMLVAENNRMDNIMGVPRPGRLMLTKTSPQNSIFSGNRILWTPFWRELTGFRT